MINFYDMNWMNTGFIWEENMAEEKLILLYSKPVHEIKVKENGQEKNVTPVKHSEPIRTSRKRVRFLFHKIKYTIRSA